MGSWSWGRSKFWLHVKAGNCFGWDELSFILDLLKEKTRLSVNCSFFYIDSVVNLFWRVGYKFVFYEGIYTDYFSGRVRPSFIESLSILNLPSTATYTMTSDSFFLVSVSSSFDCSPSMTADIFSTCEESCSTFSSRVPTCSLSSLHKVHWIRLVGYCPLAFNSLMWSISSSSTFMTT